MEKKPKPLKGSADYQFKEWERIRGLVVALRPKESNLKLLDRLIALARLMGAKLPCEVRYCGLVRGYVKRHGREFTFRDLRRSGGADYEPEILRSWLSECVERGILEARPYVNARRREVMRWRAVDPQNIIRSHRVLLMSCVKAIETAAAMECMLNGQDEPSYIQFLGWRELVSKRRLQRLGFIVAD
jgi:hypothetical protein